MNRLHSSHTCFRQNTCAFVAVFLFCILSNTETKIPPPLVLTRHVSRPNKFLHLYYLYLRGTFCVNAASRAEGWPKRVLLAWRNSFRQLWSCFCNTGSTTRFFFSPNNWVSDQERYFINYTIWKIASDHQISHPSTVAYNTCKNETVECLNREILHSMYVLLAQLYLSPYGFAVLIVLLPTILNEAPLAMLGANQSADCLTRTPL